MNTFTCIIDKSKWEEFLKTATIVITSPSGNSITIKKSFLFNKCIFDATKKSLVDKLNAIKDNTVEFTKEEMAMLLQFSKQS